MSGVSLRLRLALIGAAAVVLALGAAGFALSLLFADHIERRAVAEMQVQVDQVLAGLVMGANGLTVASPPADPRFSRPYGGLYWQVEANGRTLRSRSLWDQTLALPRDRPSGGAVRLQKLEGPNGVPALGLERNLRLSPALGGGNAWVIVAIDRAELSAARDAFVADLAPYLAALALALVAAQAVQLFYGLKPLKRIGQRVAALRAGRAARMGGTWPAEVLPLAGEIDALLAAREAEIARARTRAGDLAHGLKTPLQALLGEAGRLRARGDTQAAAAIEEIAGAMRSHVERELARARAAGTSGGARADIARAITSIHAVLSRTPDGQRVRWQITVPTELTAAIDPADLAEALGALAENAARHARSVVVIEAKEHGGRVRIAISDDGPGVPEAWLSDIARRGQRLDESVSGEGLGIAIAADMAEAAGGLLEVRNGATGVTATLDLPKVQS
ncbi:MAG: ATP-binding protein [Pseudorhodoplanes sp.]